MIDDYDDYEDFFSYWDDELCEVLEFGEVWD
jgi:hypothetical protein